jgi:DNA-binding IclR family transcriptional regulator
MKQIEDDYTGVKSLLKAVSVLKCFSPHDLEVGPSEVSRKVGISKAQAFRILSTLASSGILERNTQNQKYTIGPLLYFLGNLYISTRDIVKTAEPILLALNDITGEALNLSIFDKGYITVILRALAKSRFRADIHMGELVPAYGSAMGKAFLSELEDKEIDDYYTGEYLEPRTSKTITSKSQLKIQLNEIRKTGVSYTKEEGFEGIEGIASLIRDRNGKAVAAMSIHLPVYKANDVIRERFKKLIIMGCSLISYRMGYQTDKSPIHDIQEIREWWQKSSSLEN